MSSSDRKVTHVARFIIAYNGKEIGAIKMNLFGDIAPKTVANFVAICNGAEITTRGGGKRRVQYKGSSFHRIIPNFMIQGGDVTNHNGTGGGSIYGERFDDEAFTLKHDKPFLLSMANAGMNTNGSQFFITTVPTPHLDGRHVVFGELADKASESVAKALEGIGSQTGATKGKATIADSSAFAYTPSDSVPIGTKVFFDVQIGDDTKTKRIKMGLFDSVVPRTAQNFKEFCKGYTFDTPLNVGGKEISQGTYKNSTFHRIIPEFMIQGGDFTAGNGTGGVSIYGEKFKDENFALIHDRPYLLSMANAGPNTNGSQFFITTAVTSWLDGKHVVFGRVDDDDSQAALRSIERQGSDSGKPKCTIKIVDCGLLP